MQNTPQTFRGAGAPGVNFSEHSYDNHVGVHCQPSGYQPYPNQPYHPLPSPRQHHYGNHQMQQNMPYRHHGGAYAPNQNQYGSNMNQDMYRNHSGYANNRNMSSKSWTETNSSNEMMAPYGQVSHSPMMNNPQMPVSTMRSPPHATSNLNPAPPPQGQQHYRQMQSPAHSPHSWSQAQIPSPGVMHSSRTTPSPLPTHVRSPGHGQPFSPPAAHPMNMQPHQQPPENGQIPQPINSSGGADSQNPSNPLHSLQKMVMLDQDPKAMLPIMADGSEQYANHCGPHNYAPEDSVNTESKDSAYSTYYNMDENRFESKPSGSNSSYSTVQQVSNCNFPGPSPQLINSEEAPNTPGLPNHSSSVPDCLQSDLSAAVSQGKNSISSIAHSQNNQNVVQNDCTPISSDCPPHAESAPVFTDQTAVSTNSEQALESKPDLIVKSDADQVQLGETPSVNIFEKLESSASEEKLSNDAHESTDNSREQFPEMELSNSGDVHSNAKEGQFSLESDGSSKENSSSCHSDQDIEKCSSDQMTNKPGNSSTVKVSAEVHQSNDEEVAIHSNCKASEVSVKEVESDNSEKSSHDLKSNVSFDETSSPESHTKELSSNESSNTTESKNSKISPECNKAPDSNNSVEEIARNPVKVVIHRIRKDDSNDTWHVPSKNNGGESCINVIENSVVKKSECKIPNVGPQIVILSPVTPEKKFGFRSSVDENSIITIKEEDDEEEEMKIIVHRTPMGRSESSKNMKDESGNQEAIRNPDKKRGRPVGSKNKIKPGASVKKKKGRRGHKKKKLENSKQKIVEVLSKPKKLKVFNGPYVHITGSKESPSSISVVNVAQKEEEKISKIPVKRNFNLTINRIKKKPVGHLSTLSPTYDAFNRDKTWLCIFCHKGSHHGGLGDLYGPYYIKDKNYGNAKSSTPPASGNPARAKKRRSDHDDRASKKSKQTAGQSAAESTPVKNSGNDSDSHLKETWIHEDCAVWCQSISLIGEEVQGLEEAVTDAYENTCCQCSLSGATLGCWGKGCKELYHYTCAKETGCQLDIENFSLLCPNHQKKLRAAS